MNLNNVITGSPVTSGELRAARDQRVLKKWELLTPGGEICLVAIDNTDAGFILILLAGESSVAIVIIAYLGRR